MLSALVESALGFSVFIATLLAGRPLMRLHRRRPTPELLRSETASELIVLGYFVTLIISFAVGLHGVL